MSQEQHEPPVTEEEVLQMWADRLMEHGPFQEGSVVVDQAYLIEQFTGLRQRRTNSLFDDITDFLRLSKQDTP